MKIEGYGKKIALSLGLASNILSKPLKNELLEEQCFNDLAISNCTQNTMKILSSNEVKFGRGLKIKSRSKWPNKIFSPYVQISSNNIIDINDIYNKTGQKYYMFAFMNSFNNSPQWSEETKHNGTAYDNQIDELRRNGGNIMISFGGADGVELATSITNEKDLQKAYQQVIDKYNLTWMDLDIEGESIKDTVVNSRRNKVMAKLQKENKDLELSYCLPADLKGLSLMGVRVLEDAIKKGVSINVVNAMAMHYGHEVTDIFSKRMVEYIITTATKVNEQIQGLNLKDTKVGITVVIGKNGQEVFTIEDANELLEWSKQKDWMRLLSFWTANRDVGLGESENGLTTLPYEFTNIFKNFTQGQGLKSHSNESNTTLNIAIAAIAISIGIVAIGCSIKYKRKIPCITEGCSER